MGRRESKQTAESFQRRHDEDDTFAIKESAIGRFFRSGREEGDSESWHWPVSTQGHRE